jgi:CBS domain-containing protein
LQINHLADKKISKSAFSPANPRRRVSEKRVRHLPVFEGKKLIGIVSIGDLVKSKIGDQKFLIDQLEHYIRR